MSYDFIFNKGATSTQDNSESRFTQSHSIVPYGIGKNYLVIGLNKSTWHIKNAGISKSFNSAATGILRITSLYWIVIQLVVEN